MLHYETIEPHTLDLLKRIQARGEFAETRLVGGTALALQLGHRVSVDLDLFGSWPEERTLPVSFRQSGLLKRAVRRRMEKCSFTMLTTLRSTV